MTISATTQGLRPGVCTSTSRPTVPFDGMVIYETDTNRVLVWDNSAWVMIADTDNPPGMQLIKTQTVGSSVSSVEVTGAFSTDFNNYRVIYFGGTGSASEYLYLTIGSAATNYYWGFSSINSGTSAFVGSVGYPNTNFPAGYVNTNSCHADIEIHGPFATRFTYLYSRIPYALASVHGWLNNSTSYTSFTLTRGGAVTFSSGTIAVYGYRDSI